MKKLILFISAVILCSCITIKKNQLPDLHAESVVTDKKIEIRFNDNIDTQEHTRNKKV